MRAAVRPGCAVLLWAGLAQAPCSAQDAPGAAQCRRDARILEVLEMFRARGVPEAEMAGMVQSPDVFRHGAGDAQHRLALLRTVYHGGEPGVAAAPDCRAPLR